MSAVHSILPARLTAAVDEVLGGADVEHVAHGVSDPVAAAAAAAGDPRALAVIGPYRSADVAEAVEVTAPAGLPLLAPVATWAGVTREDEPGCGDPCRHGGTVLRLVARDTVVAASVAADVRASARRALVVAGEHEYGRQLDGQLRLAGLPRADGEAEADLAVLCGLAGQPEIARAAATSLPIVAFDGVQRARLDPERVLVALPFAPADGVSVADLFAGVERARWAAGLILAALDGTKPDRTALVSSLRTHGAFDAHGDPLDPPVWLWRAAPGWDLRPERPLA